MPRGYQHTGKNLDPEFRKQRSALGGSASHSTEAFVRQLVARRKELTDEQIERVRGALPPVSAEQVTV